MTPCATQMKSVPMRPHPMFCLDSRDQGIQRDARKTWGYRGHSLAELIELIFVTPKVRAGEMPPYTRASASLFVPGRGQSVGPTEAGTMDMLKPKKQWSCWRHSIVDCIACEINRATKSMVIREVQCPDCNQWISQVTADSQQCFSYRGARFSCKGCRITLIADTGRKKTLQRRDMKISPMFCYDEIDPELRRTAREQWGLPAE